MWPPKYNMFGVNVSATTYSEALECVIKAVNEGQSACVSHLAVHGLIEGARVKRFRAILNQFDLAAPDGQPVRLGLNLLYKTNLPDRCYGPTFMNLVCERAAIEGIGVYLYGSHRHVVDTLRDT